jgi:hypothetical protein
MGNESVGQDPLRYLLCAISYKQRWCPILCIHVANGATFAERKELPASCVQIMPCQLVCEAFTGSMSLDVIEATQQEIGLHNY